MKTVAYGFLALTSKICIGITTIWALVEFILFLVKKDSFDWNSLICLGVSYVSMYLFALLTVFSEHDDKIKRAEELKSQYKSSGKTSKFEERLEAMKKQQEEARNGR
jgi:hypothetical protein